jgi:zinc protease
MMVLSGSADDPAGKEGLARFTAHLLRRQAQARLRERAGGEEGTLENAAYEVQVGKDATIFGGSVPPEALEALYEHLRDMILAPAFTAEAAAAQRAAQKAEIERIRRDGADLARLMLDTLLYPNHPYGRPGTGRPGTVDSLTIEDARAFHARHFRRGNVVLGVAGPVEEVIGDRFRRDFEPLPDGVPDRATRNVTYLPDRRAVVIEEKSATRARILLGHPVAATAAHPDFHALNVACAYLGSGRRQPGRLDQELAAGELDAGARAGIRPPSSAGDEEGWSGPRFPRRQASFLIEIAASPEDAPESFGRVLRLLDEATRSTPTPEWLRVAREAALRDRAGTRPERELRERLEEILEGAPGFFARFVGSAEAVSAEEMARAARAHLRPERVGIVAVVPDAEAFRKALLAAGTGAGETDRETVPEESAGGMGSQGISEGEEGSEKGEREEKPPAASKFGLRPEQVQILKAEDLLR